MKLIQSTPSLIGLIAGALLLAVGSVSFAEPTLKQGVSIDKPQVRLLSAVAGFSDTKQIAIAFAFDAHPWLRADRVELAVGGIEGNNGTSPFISYGPVWRWKAFSPASFVELGFSPTYITEDQFSDDSNIGGHIHFTSSVAVGRRFGERRNTEFALRVQHTSNGGLEEVNPGLDLIGLNLVVNFSSS